MSLLFLSCFCVFMIFKKKKQKREGKTKNNVLLNLRVAKAFDSATANFQMCPFGWFPWAVDRRQLLSIYLWCQWQLRVFLGRFMITELLTLICSKLWLPAGRASNWNHSRLHTTCPGGCHLHKLSLASNIPEVGERLFLLANIRTSGTSGQGWAVFKGYKFRSHPQRFLL